MPFSNLSTVSGTTVYASSTQATPAPHSHEEAIVIACSDEVSPLTTGNSKVALPWPYTWNVEEMRVNLNTAPVGADLIIRVRYNDGTTDTTRTITVPDGETEVVVPVEGAGSQLPERKILYVDITQVGSTTNGTGLKLTIIGRQTT